MIITCSKSDLAKGVNIVSKAVPSRTTLAILECILIDASSEGIRLTANDTELGIETKIEGWIEERGIIALDAKVFSEIVRKLPDSDVRIETDGAYRAFITCEKSKFNIAGRSGDEFSYLPYVTMEDQVTISEFVLKEMIRQTIFSVSDNENNKVMTGELLEIRENRMRMISLDGHRISIRNIDLKENYNPKSVIIPGKSLQEISRILPGEADDMADIYFSQNYIMFEFGVTKVLSRLIDGKYFNVDQMFSEDYETMVVVNRRELLDCIDRATLLVREGDKKPVIISINDDYMELRINSFIGSMDEEIEIEKEGKDIMIGFNPKFLIDALRVIDDEEVILYFVNAKSPCFIRDDDGDYIYLILPVNFNAASV